MATGYFFSMPYFGHINPCLPIIAELTRRGETIVFYGAERFRAVAEAAGARFRAFDHEQPDDERHGRDEQLVLEADDPRGIQHAGEGGQPTHPPIPRCSML